MRRKLAGRSKTNLEHRKLMRAIEQGESSGKGSLSKVKAHLKKISVRKK